MAYLRLILCAGLSFGATGAASASWLHCVAFGRDQAGPLAAVTTIADVGPTGAARLHDFEHLLADYIAKGDPDATDIHATCLASDDQIEAAHSYARNWNHTTHQLGWQRVTLVQPSAWLPEATLKNDPGDF